MTQGSAEPLGPPPRKAHVRRVARNIGRAYATLFGLVIVVFLGWAALDAIRWPDLTGDQQLLTVGFGVLAVLAFVIYRFVSHPLRRELRLARRGETSQGEIVSIGKREGRRSATMLVYTFRTAAGETIQSVCALPRRMSIAALAPGQSIEVLYDAKKPCINKPRLALEHIEFGEIGKPGAEPRTK